MAKEEKSKDKPATEKNAEGHEIAIIKKKMMRDLEFPFTDADIQKKGLALAKATIEKGKIEDEKKQANDAFKIRIDEQQGIIEKISDELTVLFEVKTVSVDVVRNFTTGKREYWYGKGDAYKKYGEEKLTSSDHALELDLLEGKEPEHQFQIKANDFVIVGKGKKEIVVQITEEDVTNGIQNKGIKRLATQDEIDAHIEKTKA